MVFAIYGDKEEIFRSEPIRDNQLRTVTIPVHNVDLLDLTVFPTQDGKSQDWGVWIDPILTRGGGSRPVVSSRDSDLLEEPRTE